MNMRGWINFVRFFSPGFSTGGEPMATTQQSATDDFPDFVENSMWEKNSIVFVAVHLLDLTEPATDPRQF